MKTIWQIIWLKQKTPKRHTASRITQNLKLEFDVYGLQLSTR
jgi:hypothetical protein